jgi:hypothetical protein
VERVLFALVANRALDPGSKLAATEWVSRDVAISGLDAMTDDQAYRAMGIAVGLVDSGCGRSGGCLSGGVGEG